MARKMDPLSEVGTRNGEVGCGSVRDRRDLSERGWRGKERPGEGMESGLGQTESGPDTSTAGGWGR